MTRFPEINAGSLSAFYEDSQGNVWLGGAGLWRYADGEFKHWDALAGSGPTRVISPRREGGLWLGMGYDLVEFHDGAFGRPYTHKDGLSLGDVRALLEDEDGTLWIGTYGGGITRFKDGVFHRFTTQDELPDNVASSIVAAGEGYLWINSNLGAYRVKRQSLIDHAEVAREFSTSRPGTHILFMSGYAPDAAAGDAALGTDDAFLPKPFTAETLARTIRQLLDEGVKPTVKT